MNTSIGALTLVQIIITSYGTVCSEYQLGREVKEDDEDDWLAKHGYGYSRSSAYILIPSFSSGLLARMEWYRVILDESQFIRTRYIDYYTGSLI